MKKIDGNFDEQKKIVLASRLFYIADMHELTNPNNSARRLQDNIRERSPADAELIALYENCEDPLVEAFRQVISARDEEGKFVLSLGDLVANRIDFGGGTEKSIVGKFAKKARELGVAQHEYILEQVEAHKPELQEYAHRNNLWTALRFQALDNLLADANARNITFAHLNGNADVLASLVSEAVLPSERAPTTVYNNSRGLHRYFEALPGFIPLAGKYCEDCEYHHGTLAVIVPYTIKFGESVKHLDSLKSHLNGFDEGSLKKGYLMQRKEDLRQDVEEYPDIVCLHGAWLFIHEPMNPEQFAKKERVEGMEAYKAALSQWPISYILHGHTHDTSIVRYKFNDKYDTIQVPPSRVVRGSEIFPRPVTIDDT